MNTHQPGGILGIDPGSRQTGYGIVTTNGYDIVCEHYGCIRLPSVLPLPERLALFSSEFEIIIDKFHISTMAIETLFTAKNIQSVFKLGQVRGVAIMIASRRGLAVAEYSPASVKSAVVGYGRATKEQIQFMVQKLLKLPSIPKPQDAADALAIAICHLNTIKFQKRIFDRS